MTEHTDPWVARSFDTPHLTFRCDCGWTGPDAAVTDWAVERDRDRVVRRCPDCDRPVPEWGTIAPIAAAELIAAGPLREALDRTG